MLLRELFEDNGNDVAIIFGRFNPPHFGHKAAWETAAQFSNWYVGTNQSTQGPKDPLPFDVKIEAMKTIMPEIEGHLVPEQTWFTLAAAVYKKHGADAVLHIVTDSEDAQIFYPAIKKQNGIEGPHGFYKFKDIVWAEAKRLSKATNLRQAIVDDDPEAFARAAGVPADTQVAGEPFFELVKKYMLPYMQAAAEKERAKAEKEKLKAEKSKKKNTEPIDESDAIINEIDLGLITNILSVAPMLSKMIISNALTKASREKEQTSKMVDVMAKKVNDQPVTPEETKIMGDQFKDLVTYGVIAAASGVAGATAGPEAGAGVALLGVYKKELLDLIRNKGPEIIINLLKTKGQVDVINDLAQRLVAKNMSENFADGRNPQDKGEHKGQHWMANMKAGKKKNG